MSESGCIFCAIVDGRAEAARVYEDDVVLAFMDIFPVSPGHTLVIIKQHCENIFEAPAHALSAVAAVSRRVALALREVFQAPGIVVAQLNGAAVGQTVFHYHMHLVPGGTPVPLVLHGRRRATADELNEQAARLSAALAHIS